HATVLSAHYINPDTLVVDGVSEVTDPAGADSPPLRWAFTNVFVKSHSRWLMHTSRCHRVDVGETARRPPRPPEKRTSKPGRPAGRMRVTQVRDHAMPIRSYQTGDELAQVRIYNQAAGSLPGFKPGTPEEVARRYAADPDAGSRYYAVEEGG